MQKRRRLPSLGSLAAFEVAAKHQSFTKAAGELHVTQAAVSQQIRILEDQIGCKLFSRQTDGLKLTWEGKYLLRSVSQGLDVLSDAVRALSGEQAHQTITISATNGMAQLFLPPIIECFSEQVTDVEVVVMASDEDASLRKYENIDFAFVCGNERSEVGSKNYHLFPEIVQPVCSPAYFAEFGPFPTPQSLSTAQLLHLHEKHWTSKAIDWLPLTWRNWFEANDVEMDNQSGGLRSNSYPLLVDAAIAGKGVVLGWKHLVANHINEDRLCFAHHKELQVRRFNYVELGSRGIIAPWMQCFLDIVLEEASRINEAGVGIPPR